MKERKKIADEKLVIVMEGLQEKKSVSEISREHQIRQTLYYRWWDKFLEAGKRILIDGAPGNHADLVEIERLQEIIGKQAIQIELLEGLGYKVTLEPPQALHHPNSYPIFLLAKISNGSPPTKAASAQRL